MLVAFSWFYRVDDWLSCGFEMVNSSFYVGCLAMKRKVEGRVKSDLIEIRF